MLVLLDLVILVCVCVVHVCARYMCVQTWGRHGEHCDGMDVHRDVTFMLGCTMPLGHQLLLEGTAGISPLRSSPCFINYYAIFADMMHAFRIHMRVTH